jgi:hypothetical protein
MGFRVLFRCSTLHYRAAPAEVTRRGTYSSPPRNGLGGTRSPPWHQTNASLGRSRCGRCRIVRAMSTELPRSCKCGTITLEPMWTLGRAPPSATAPVAGSGAGVSTATASMTTGSTSRNSPHISEPRGASSRRLARCDTKEVLTRASGGGMGHPYAAPVAVAPSGMRCPACEKKTAYFS